MVNNKGCFKVSQVIWESTAKVVKGTVRRYTRRKMIQTNQQLDHDEHKEDEEYNEVDIEQDNEGANDVNVEPPMARPERERQPPACI